MVCGIYIIKNKKNDKIYIGQSIDIKKRWNQHKRELNNNIHGNAHLQNAWNKYGEENFEFIVLDVCKPKELNDLEIYYIKNFDSMNTGYNLTIGGEGTRGYKPKRDTGFYRVSRVKSTSCKQGFRWMYQYKDEKTRKYKQIMSVDLKKLEEKVIKKGLKWEIIDRNKANKSINWKSRKGCKVSEEIRIKRGEAISKYSLWHTAKCSYHKGVMFQGGRDGSKPARCFQTSYNGKRLPIGNNTDFLTCEIIHDIIEESM